MNSLTFLHSSSMAIASIGTWVHWRATWLKISPVCKSPDSSPVDSSTFFEVSQHESWPVLHEPIK